jgi:hypothetical protein
MQPSQPASVPRAALVYAALLGSVAAGALSLLALARSSVPRPSPPPIAPPAAEGRGEDDLRAELAALRLEVAALRAHPGSVQPSQRATTPEHTPPSGASPDEGVPQRRYVRFIVPTNAIEIHESETGAVSVTNQDPALTGKALMVKALRADGTEETLRILVPRPGR